MNTETQHPHVVLDTNIIVSALTFGGKPSSIILLASQKRCALFTSLFILEELERVLKIKFVWDSTRVGRVVKAFRSQATVVQPLERVTHITEDDSDNRVLECALACHADYIVSGDRHLLKLKTFHATKIVTAGEFLNAIQSQ